MEKAIVKELKDVVARAGEEKIFSIDANYNIDVKIMKLILDSSYSDSLKYGMVQSYLQNDISIDQILFDIVGMEEIYSRSID